MPESQQRSRDPRTHDEVLRELSLGLAALVERLGEDFGSCKDATDEWFKENRVILGLHDFGGRLGVVFHHVERVPAHIAVYAASLIHGSRMIYDHVEKAKRHIAPVVPGPDKPGLREVIEGLDNLAKHQLLPILMLAIREPRVDLIDKSDMVVGTVDITISHQIAEQGGPFIFTEQLPDLGVPEIELGFRLEPRLAVRDPMDDSNFYELGEVLINARDWGLEYAMPFLDWLSAQPPEPEPIREGTATDENGTYRIIPPGATRPEGA